MQSHHGLVGRLVALWKNWLVCGVNFESFDLKQMNLGIAMALHTLLEREHLGFMYTIATKAMHVPGSHIIARDLEPQLKIPKRINIVDKAFSSRLHRFCSARISVAASFNRNVQPTTANIFWYRVS